MPVSAASPSGAVCSGKKVRFMVKKRPCPSGAFYGQEAILPVRCVFRIKKREQPVRCASVSKNDVPLMNVLHLKEPMILFTVHLRADGDERGRGHGDSSDKTRIGTFTSSAILEKLFAVICAKTLSSTRRECAF